MLSVFEVKETLQKYGITTKATNLKEFKHGNKIILQLGKYALVLEPNQYKKNLIEMNITDKTGVLNMINKVIEERKLPKVCKEMMLNDYLPVLEKEFVNGYYEVKEIWQIKGKLGYDFMGILRGYQVISQVS